MSSCPERFSHSSSQDRSVKETIGFAFLKPGYETIFPPFQKDLEESGLSVVHAKPVRLRDGSIDYIYKESTKEPFYPHMRRHLGGKAILAMIVEGGGAPHAAQDVLHSLKKGANGYPNLRKKYHRGEDVVSDPDFEEWQANIFDGVESMPPDRRDELTIKLTQGNVFHAADDPDDAMQTFRTLKIHNPEFYEENETTQAIKLARLVEYLESLRYDSE